MPKPSPARAGLFFGRFCNLCATSGKIRKKFLPANPDPFQAVADRFLARATTPSARCK